MGITGQHPMTGRDLSAEPTEQLGRAMMQYNANFAWMQQTRDKNNRDSNNVVVLREGKAPAHGVYDVTAKRLNESAPPHNAKALEEIALANSLLPALLYREQRYRLPN
jgi:hypothetical protein